MRNALIFAYLLVINIIQVVSNCPLYDQINWSNSDPNFKRISGIYTAISTTSQPVFGPCKVHAMIQQNDGSMIDRYIVPGSACTTAFQQHITKTANAFQYEFIGDDPKCVQGAQYTRSGNLKMLVLPNGDCFFKAVCLPPNNVTAVNLYCRNPKLPAQLSLSSLAVVNTVNKLSTLDGQTIFSIDQSCFYQIVNNSTAMQILTGSETTGGGSVCNCKFDATKYEL